MHTYMDYLVRCFNSINHWDESNLYPSVIATPKLILDFDLPSSVHLNINKKSSDYSANSLTLSNEGSVNGSIAYFYSSSVLKNVLPSSAITLQEAVNTYQFVDSLSLFSRLQVGSSTTSSFARSPIDNTNVLLYGKLNFPSNILEALLIKNFSANSRLLVKCLSTNSNLIKNHGIVTLYYQKNYPKYSNEFIYSSNEGLLGFRNLYNISLGGFIDNSSIGPRPRSSSTPQVQINNERYEKVDPSDLDSSFSREKVFYDNSKLSIGTEIWWAALSMTPGISNSLRYSTYSTYTGKPLTITLSCNPLIGLLSSSYTVKTSLNSTFCSKYDFNIYSYESNLSLGMELWNFNGNLNEEIKRILTINNSFRKLIKKKNLPELFSQVDLNSRSSSASLQHHRGQAYIHSAAPQRQRRRSTFSPTPHPDKESLTTTQNTSNIEKFKELYRNINFSSILKLSTSLSDRNFKILWAGKYKDFLVEIGCNIQPPPMRAAAGSPQVSGGSSRGKVGVSGNEEGTVVTSSSVGGGGFGRDGETKIVTSEVREAGVQRDFQFVPDIQTFGISLQYSS